MMTLVKRGGSLAALAAALALVSPALPAAAQEMPDYQPDESAPPRVRVERVEASGGPARAEIVRAERPERPERVSAPRFSPPAEPRADFAPPSSPAFSRPVAIDRIDPDIEAGAALAQRDRSERRGRGGFGSGIRARAETAVPDSPPPPRGDRSGRAGRPTWGGGGEARGDAGGWRGQRGGERGGWQQRGGGWQRGDAQAPAPVPAERQDGWQAGRRDGVGNGGRSDWQGDRTQTRRDGWQNGRGGDWQRDGRRSDWQRDRRGNDWARDGRRGDWQRDGRRDDWRRDDWRRDGRQGWQRDRNWRRDDWRWGWNGRPGWDHRDFRRWDNRWRANRSYNWLGWRNQNHFLFRPGPYFAPFRSHRYNRLNIGFFLDSLFFQPRFFINDPWAYRLPPAYGPYQWVRYYDDVLLVDIYTGEVVDVIYSFFW